MGAPEDALKKVRQTDVRQHHTVDRKTAVLCIVLSAAVSIGGVLFFVL
ncbi:MAG TPA: hypothetical protein VIM12_13160 [Noviherbaspirillum sp.]|jgi:hypothetical protein